MQPVRNEPDQTSEQGQEVAPPQDTGSENQNQNTDQATEPEKK